MKQAIEIPSKETLNKLFKYDPETGIVTRRVDARGGPKAGDVAGGANGIGYISVSIKNKRYLMHRVIWKIVYGECDRGLYIDHRNGIRDDNRILNLRIGTCLENSHNQTKAKGYHRVGNKWCSMISINYKPKCLGRFYTEAEASHAYQTAKAERDFDDYKTT